MILASVAHAILIKVVMRCAIITHKVHPLRPGLKLHRRVNPRKLIKSSLANLTNKSKLISRRKHTMDIKLNTYSFVTIFLKK